MRDYIKEHYFGLIKNALGRKEMSIAQLIKASGLCRASLTRYVDVFVEGGMLAERQDGQRRLIRVAKAK